MSKLQANIILEILGRPQEHIKEALNTLVTKLGSEEGIKLLDKTYHDPVPVKDAKDLFTAFAEVAVELESLDKYFRLIFAYMPANVELFHPEKIIFTNVDLNDVANRLISRLHEYDAITKKALFESELLAKKLKEIAPHLFQQAQQQQIPQKQEAKKQLSKKSKPSNKKQ